MSNGSKQNELVTASPVGLELLDDSEALGAISRAEIDMQITTAKAYPRVPTRIVEEAQAIACQSVEAATACNYYLPHGDGGIEGPSIRLAEIMYSVYGNLRAGARISGIGAKFVTATGFAHDLEKNIVYQGDTKRRITNKNGTRYNDDLIQKTCNAAASIAFRQAIFKVIPSVFVNEVYQAALKFAKGGEKTLMARRVQCATYFSKWGVTREMLAEAIGADDFDLIETEDLTKLGGIITAIREGDTSIDQVFPGISKAKAEAKKVPASDKPRVTGADLAGNGTKSPATAENSEVGNLDSAPPAQSSEADPVAPKDSQTTASLSASPSDSPTASEAVITLVNGVKTLDQLGKLYDTFCGPESNMDAGDREAVSDACEARHLMLEPAEQSQPDQAAKMPDAELLVLLQKSLKGTKTLKEVDGLIDDYLEEVVDEGQKAVAQKMADDRREKIRGYSQKKPRQQESFA